MGGTMEILGRNSPCPCGSGRKYKRCHGIEELDTSLKSNLGQEIASAVYKPFPPHGVSPWVVEAMKRAVRL